MLHVWCVGFYLRFAYGKINIPAIPNSLGRGVQYINYPVTITGSFASATCMVCGHKCTADDIKADIMNQVSPYSLMAERAPLEIHMFT